VGCAAAESPSEDAAASPARDPLVYFGLTPPGGTREIFAPGVVSTPAQESGLTISPDGRDVVFSVSLPGILSIVLVSWEDGRWGEPRVAPFSGHYDDWEPVFSPGGERLYFVSARPTGRPDRTENDRNLWYVERTADGWGEPVEVGLPVNAPEHREGYASVTRDGMLYFFRYDDEGANLTEIFVSDCSGDPCSEPELLGPAINTEYHDWDPFIAPDGSYLIFSSPDRPDTLGRADLYISFRAPDGAWTEAVNMGPEVNGPGTEICPFVSADGRYLFFEATAAPRTRSSATQRFTRPADGTPLTYELIMQMAEELGESPMQSYWIDAEVIEGLRRRVLGA
jgi:Tol biopolymer transport system component